MLGAQGSQRLPHPSALTLEGGGERGVKRETGDQDHNSISGSSTLDKTSLFYSNCSRERVLDPVDHERSTFFHTPS